MVVMAKTKRLELTKTHKEIMPWLARGLSAEEIGEKVGVKTRTVNSHLNAMYKANDVASRGELTWRWLHEQYALVPVLVDELTDLPNHKLFLLQTDAGLVPARKFRNRWRDDLTGAEIKADEVITWHEVTHHGSEKGMVA